MRAPLTPLKAFLHDAERLGESGLGNVDDGRLSQWLSVAQAAERVAVLSPGERSDYVNALTTRVLPLNETRPTQIEGDGRGPTDVLGKLAERLRLEAEQMELAGCFELALVTVSSVCRALSAGALSQRLLATVHMGRVMRQMGELDNAIDCYTNVTDDALAAGDGAVAAHGYIGLGNAVGEHGNRPAQKAHYLEALRLAPTGSPAELSSHLGLMVVAMAQKDLAEALLHGWRAHDLSPPDSDVQHQSISNMARIAHQAGFLEAAKSGFEFVIQRSTVPRIRIIAIGAAMRTVAELGRTEEVKRFIESGAAEIPNGAPPFETASFFLWCAEAWHALGDSRQRDAATVRAEKIADSMGFHEIRLKAEAIRMSAIPKLSPTTPQKPVFIDQAIFSSQTVRVGINRLETLAVR